MILQSIVIYGLVLIVMYVCGCFTYLRYKYDKSTETYYNWDVLIPIVFFTFIFGVRYDVGADHLSYMYNYTTGLGVERYEYIFQFVTRTFKNLGFHYALYFSLWAFIQIFCLYKALRNERYLLPFVALSFILGQYFIHWMNGIRQDTAACIFFYSVLFIYERKFIHYFICCILAMGFHTSAIILIPLYLFLKSCKDITFNKMIQIVILVFAFVVAFTKKDYISDLFPYIYMLIVDTDYVRYSQGVIEGYNDKTSAGDGLSFIILFLLNLFIIVYSNQLKTYFNNGMFIIYYNLYFWGAVFQLFFINNLLLARPFRYFRLFNMLMIAYFLYYLYQNRMIGKNFIVLVIVLLFLLLLFAATIKNDPYNFIWYV